MSCEEGAAANGPPSGPATPRRLGLGGVICESVKSVVKMKIPLINFKANYLTSLSLVWYSLKSLSAQKATSCISGVIPPVASVSLSGQGGVRSKARRAQ